MSDIKQAKIIEELDTLTDQLFSEDTSIRKKAARTLERKPLMNLMKSEASVAREWFIDKLNQERIGKAIENEKEESVLATLLSTVGFVCERFSYSSLLSWSLSIDYLKFGCQLFIKHLNSESKTVRFASALALTQFRVTEAWEILYDFTEKINSNVYERIAIRLFNYGNNRLKIFDQRDSSKIQIFDTLGIVYCKEGLTQAQLIKYRAVLESAYKQKITSEAQDAIIRALQSIGNKETITFLSKIAAEEKSKYRKETIMNTIESLRQN